MSLQSEPTMSQLRRDIDSGRTGDKVAHPDPAAAPLGTDEEAAGTPVPASAVADAQRAEVGTGATTAEEVTRASSPMMVTVLAIFAVAVVVLVLWAMFD